MGWYWVKFYFRGDGYYDDDSWQLVAATGPAHIIDTYKDTMYRVDSIVPMEESPIPAKPRVTKYAS